MKSLKLELDDLQIESFSTNSEPEERGTVAGMSGDAVCVSGYITCPGWTCVGVECTNSGDPYKTFGCPGGGGGSLAYTQCEPETCDPFICGPY